MELGRARAVEVEGGLGSEAVCVIGLVEATKCERGLGVGRATVVEGVGGELRGVREVVGLARIGE